MLGVGLPCINGLLHSFLFGWPYEIELKHHLKHFEAPFSFALFNWHDYASILVEVWVRSEVSELAQMVKRFGYV